jgi:hypothetical protein
VIGPALARLQLRRRSTRLANAALIATLGRALGIVQVVEYPKCGGSWVRNMLQHYLGGAPYLADRLVRRGSVVQSHRLRLPGAARPIVVVRDPRDLFVSFYYHETCYEGRAKALAIARHFAHDPTRPPAEDFAAYLEAKLTHRTFPPFSYRTFVARWLARPGICLIRYEDLLADPAGGLGRMLDHLGAAVDDAKLAATVAFTAFAAETARIYGQARAPGEADPARFLRKGIAGDWRNHFDERACRLLEAHEGETLRRLGYEADAGWIARFLAAAPAAAAVSARGRG